MIRLCEVSILVYVCLRNNSDKMYKIIYICAFLVLVSAAPQVFVTRQFKVGIEYENSLPMSGGSDRYKHRNNLEPFHITVTASAKNNYVISYLDVTTITDEEGEVEFNMVRGGTGSKSAVFQLISNNTEFLKYSYLVYGIRDDEYKKIMNIITVPRNSSSRFQTNIYSIIVSMALVLRLILVK